MHGNGATVKPGRRHHISLNFKTWGYSQMSALSRVAAAVMLSTIALAPLSQANAADMPPKYKAAKAIPDLPFFLVNDNRFTYAYIFDGTNPGAFSVRPDGTFNGKTPKQVVAFTHFDVWAYGTNFFNIAAFKSGHNDPASPCSNAGVLITGAPADCAGATEIYGLFRSTIGFNEVFNTKAFSFGPLHNVSFEFGADANSENTFLAPAKKDIVVGLQFAFDLPYKGYFNVSPLYYKEWNHNGFLQCGVFPGPVPGVNCSADGNTDYNGTWAVETNYYMDLGFLPESVRYFSISGRAGWYGKKGDQNAPLPAGIGTATAVELNSEPIRLTFDASKAFWGDKYSHFVDVWVAYRYWQNKFGLDHKNSPGVCTVAGVSTNSCNEESAYAGVTVKF